MVLGATGLLGQALVRELKNEQIMAPSSRDVDLRDSVRVVEAIRASRPDWVALAAAYTDVDGCESNRELAFAVNSQGAANVAEAARVAGSRLLFISTDYVFDGGKRSPYEIDDKKNPVNVYGESKARAEESLVRILPEVCIARTSWLYGPGGKCFPATILKHAETRSQLSVVNDQRGCPTYTSDLASALAQLCRTSARGFVHVTNAGECTWHELAKEVLDSAGLPVIVKPVTTAEFPRPARRPPYSVLSPASLEAHGIQMPHWKDAVRRYLEAVR